MIALIAKVTLAYESNFANNLCREESIINSSRMILLFVYWVFKFFPELAVTLCMQILLSVILAKSAGLWSS